MKEGLSYQKHVDGCTKIKWVYNLPKTDQGEYFCLLGCKTFKDPVNCKYHMLTKHKKLVHLWGLSSKRLKEQFEIEDFEADFEHLKTKNAKNTVLDDA